MLEFAEEKIGHNGKEDWRERAALADARVGVEALAGVGVANGLDVADVEFFDVAHPVVVQAELLEYVKQEVLVHRGKGSPKVEQDYGPAAGDVGSPVLHDLFGREVNLEYILDHRPTFDEALLHVGYPEFGSLFEADLASDREDPVIRVDDGEWPGVFGSVEFTELRVDACNLFWEADHGGVVEVFW